MIFRRTDSPVRPFRDPSPSAGGERPSTPLSDGSIIEAMSDAMRQVTTFLSRSFTFNTKTARMTTGGFTPEDWDRVPSPAGGNSAHWIFGHIVASRRSLARKLGADVPELEWEKLFGMNVQPASSAGYPSPDELHADLEASGTVLSQRLEELTEEQARSEWAPFPDGGTTLLDGTQFLFFHEAYHLGQLGLIRRMGGKPGFA